MKSFIFSLITCFIGFMLGIMYTVQAAENTPILKIIATIKGLLAL